MPTTGLLRWMEPVRESDLKVLKAPDRLLLFILLGLEEVEARAIDIERLLKVSGVRRELRQELGFVVEGRPEVGKLCQTSDPAGTRSQIQLPI